MVLGKVIILLFYFCLFNFVIYRFPIFQLNRFKPWISIALFNLKFLTGIFIWLIYTFYYTDVQNNDIHKFYNDALILRQSASEDPGAFAKLMIGREDETTSKFTAQMKNWERNFDEAPVNENKTIIRLNALLLFLSFKTYFVHILFMCFFSLFGWVLLTNAVFDFVNTKAVLLALPVLLLPSVLFWTSGIMKEPLLVLGLGIFVYGMLRLRGWKSCGWMIAGGLLILSAKFYVLICLLPAAVSFLIYRQANGLVPLAIKYAIVCGVFLLIVFNIQHVAPGIHPSQMLVNKQRNSIQEALYFNAGSRIEIPAIAANATSILKNIPQAIWNCLMRPYPWEGKNMMMLASAIENIFILFLLLACLWLTNWSDIRHLHLLFFLLAFSLSYFAVIGICTPVLGNLVRYKAPLLPVFLFTFGLNLRWRKEFPALEFLFRK